MLIACYRDSFLNGSGVAVASARAGNVIGGGDWSDNRLLPDAVKAWGGGQILRIRRPEAIRPWQHVLEALAGYLHLAERLWARPELAGAYNFGPHTYEAATVRKVITIAQQVYGQGEIIWGDGTDGPHEAGWLALEIAKARVELGVQPLWGLTDTINRTMEWYREQKRGADSRSLCEADIASYRKALLDR